MQGYFKMKTKLYFSLFAFFLCICGKSFAVQECYSSMPESTPTKQFKILNEGHEVLDQKTGLIWRRCVLGQNWDGKKCSGEPQRLTWKKALEETINSKGNYRLPNAKELATIVETKCVAPAVNAAIFPSLSDEMLWSSTPLISKPHSLKQGKDDSFRTYVLSSNNGLLLTGLKNVLGESLLIRNMDKAHPCKCEK